MLKAFSNHFLTDAFSSGHVRTPRADLGKYWHEKVPMFFYNFKMFMAEKIAKYVNDHNIRGALTVDTLMFKGAGVFPAGSLDTINGELRKKEMPEITFGHIVSGALHDYDNEKGVDVQIEGRRTKLFGDSQLMKGGKPQPGGRRHAECRRRGRAHEPRRGRGGYASGLEPQGFLDRNGGLFAAESMLPQVEPELAQDVPQFAGATTTSRELLADPALPRGSDDHRPRQGEGARRDR